MSEDLAEHACIAREQRDWLRDVAGQIERGDPLDAMARAVVAQIVRHFADGIPDKPRRKRGNPASKIDAYGVAVEFETLMRNPNLSISASAARDRLAFKYDVTVEAIRQALAKKGADARSLFDAFGVPRRVSSKSRE